MALADDAGTVTVDGTLTLTRLGFGAMRLCGPDIIGPPEDEAAARAVLERAVELGVDFIDTADSYGPGVSERLIGTTLGDRADLTIGTKAGLLRNLAGDWQPHGDPAYLRNQVLCSRDRLRADTIDLYQFHRPDPETPFEESVQTFAELKDAGLVEHVGLSNVTVEQLTTARDHVSIATVQNRFNVADREHQPVLEACESAGIGFIPWYPLAAGDLGNKRGALETIAERHEATVRQVALAWLLAHSEVTIPIPGTSSVEHLEANVGAATLDLDDEDLTRLAA
ncbi:MAG: aldo/keto reductase [Halobacteriaceae archaeon]